MLNSKIVKSLAYSHYWFKVCIKNIQETSAGGNARVPHSCWQVQRMSVQCRHLLLNTIRHGCGLGEKLVGLDLLVIVLSIFFALGTLLGMLQ